MRLLLRTLWQTPVTLCRLLYYWLKEANTAEAYEAWKQDPSRGMPYEEFRAELVNEGLLEEI